MHKFWTKLHQFGLSLTQSGHTKEAEIILSLGHYVPVESEGVPNPWRSNMDYGEGFYHGEMKDKEPLGKWRKKRKTKKTAQSNKIEKSLDYGLSLVMHGPSATHDDADYSIHFEKDGQIAYEDCGAEIYDTQDFEDFDAGFTYFIDWILLEGSPRTEDGGIEIQAYSAEDLLDKIAELPFVKKVLEWEKEDAEWKALPQEERDKCSKCTRDEFQSNLGKKLRKKKETPSAEELEKWFRESEDE